MVGDYNTAHEAIDLARPKTNTKASGFLPEERAEITRWLDAGWRIDYVLASPSANRRVTDSFIWPDVPGSDHCPVGVDLD